MTAIFSLITMVLIRCSHIYGMEHAYLLINCDQNKDDDVLEKLKLISGIIEVTKVFGAYDLIAKIQASNTYELKQKIMPIVKNVIDIRSALTLVTSSA